MQKEEEEEEKARYNGREMEAGMGAWRELVACCFRKKDAWLESLWTCLRLCIADVRLEVVVEIGMGVAAGRGGRGKWDSGREVSCR